MSTKSLPQKPRLRKEELATIPPHKPTSMTDFIARTLSLEGLKTLQELVARCPLPGSKEIAHRLNEKIREKIRNQTCGTRVGGTL